MKRILFLILLIPFSMFSQDPTTVHRKYMFGLNATDFVKSFLSFNETQPQEGTPYNFTFRYINERQTAFRAGLGLNFTTFTESQEDDDDDEELTTE